MCLLHNILYNIMNFYHFGRIRRSNKILSIHKFLFGLYRMNLQPHLQYSLLTTIINGNFQTPFHGCRQYLTYEGSIYVYGPDTDKPFKM